MSQPSAKKPRSKPRVKRTKTFSGCQTCRKRSLKCGEEKPACLRCRRNGAVCGGYRVELIWPDDESKRGRRQLLEPSLKRRRILSEHALDKALADVQLGDGSNDLVVDLFSVFSFNKSQDQEPHSAHLETRDDRSAQVPNTSASDEAVSSDIEDVIALEATQASSDVHALSSIDGNHNFDDVVSRRGFHNVLSPTLDLFPIRKEQERYMLQYWSRFVCGILAAFPRPDNVFRDVITPMALTALSFNSDSAGHSALLAAIYSLTAASRRTLRQDDTEQYDALCRKHLISSVQHLGQALSTTNFEEQQAILAAILLLVITSAFTGDPSEWRVHLMGGLFWMDSIDLDAWAQSRAATTLYQLFFTIASLRPAGRCVAKEISPQKRMLRGSNHFGVPNDVKLQKNKWHIFGTWGVPDVAMDIIERINHYINTDTAPTGVELTELELAIYQSDPRHAGIEAAPTLCEQLALAHAMLFHYGCHIYFGSGLLKRPPSAMQYFVTCAIEHIEEVMELETGLNISGLMWPTFITACETEGKELRDRVLRCFDRREGLGMPYAADAKRIIFEVWRRRREGDVDMHVSWQDVMEDLDIDIILS